MTRSSASKALSANTVMAVIIGKSWSEPTRKNCPMARPVRTKTEHLRERMRAVALMRELVRRVGTLGQIERQEEFEVAGIFSR
jgi:hypothetical protein